MKLSAFTLSILAVSSFAMVATDASSPEGDPTSRATFLIYVPDENSDPIERSMSVDTLQEAETSNKRTITSVEIVKSIEVKLNDTQTRPPESTDLLFSDNDRKTKTNNNGKDNSRNREIRYRRVRIGSSTPRPQEKRKEVVPNNSMSDDGLDFNSRILLGNILIRKAKGEDSDGDKYSFYSEPKAAGNKYHATYINHNATLPMNKSRINVKFPPKVFPFKNPSVANKTSIANTNILAKNQTQKALYRSRIGKQTVKLGRKNKFNTTETTQQSENKDEKGQSITHWDFGKKTTNDPSNEVSYTAAPTAASINPTTADLTTNFPPLVHPTRSTQQPLPATTPKTVTENVINRPIGQQGVVHTSLPNQQIAPIYKHIKSVQGIPTVTTEKTVKSIPQAYQVFHTHNGNAFRQNIGVVRQSPGGQIPTNLAQNIVRQNPQPVITQTNVAKNPLGLSAGKPSFDHNIFRQSQVGNIPFNAGYNVLRQNHIFNTAQSKPTKNLVGQTLFGNVIQQNLAQNLARHNYALSATHPYIRQNIIAQTQTTNSVQTNVPQNPVSQNQAVNIIHSNLGQSLLEQTPGGNVQQSNLRHNSVKQTSDTNSVQKNNEQNAGGSVTGHSIGTNTVRQDLGPQLFPNPDYNNEIRGGSVDGINTGAWQSEQQDVRNWQPVYFVPHVALPPQPAPAAVVALQTVNTETGPQTIPIFLQQQQSLQQHGPQASNPTLQNLYPSNVLPNPAVPTQNGLIYEGELWSIDMLAIILSSRSKFVARFDYINLHWCSNVMNGIFGALNIKRSFIQETENKNKQI
ncbi:hypothetical protein C0J52_12709 [Blattella germanica]|nr:hypothetical protein C0J52_12709 [Blattella germanica]